jgi:hypothetical protein
MGSRGEVGDHKINVPWKDGLDPFFLNESMSVQNYKGKKRSNFPVNKL